MQSSTRPGLPLAIVLCLFLGLLFNSFALWKQYTAYRTFKNKEDPYKSYIGEDVPYELPGFYSPAAMQVHLTNKQYPLEDDHAWASSLAPERGFIRLGPNGRSFGVSLYHQLHCVNALRFAYVITRDQLVTDPVRLRNDLYHANHCFQFLRQSVLCKADTTLIPVKPHLASNESFFESPLHRCRDWESIRGEVMRLQDKWRAVPLPPPEDEM